MNDFGDESGKGSGTKAGAVRSKTYLGGFYKTPEQAKEVELLRNAKAAVLAVRGVSVDLGVRVGEHEQFTEEAWKVIGGVLSLIADGYLTREELLAKVAQRKAEREEVARVAAEKLATAQAKRK